MTSFPGPEALFGICDGCGHKSRLFELQPNEDLCLHCYRDLIDAVLETVFEEGDDAAA